MKEKRRLTVRDSTGFDTKKVPVIYLQGKWLEELGYHIGDKINVTCSDERIVITKE